MGAPAVRTARRLLLGKELRHMMQARNVTQAKAAEALRATQQKLADILNGRGAITWAEVKVLAEFLGFGGEEHLNALAQLHRDSNKRGHWTTGHNRAYLEEFRLMVDLERNASELRCNITEVVPSLLQTEAYIRAIFASAEVDPSPDDGPSAEERVQARLARQAVLDQPTPPQYHVVLWESCLRHEYGSFEIMREQIEHLIHISRRPNIVLQVIPFRLRTGLSPVFTVPFQTIQVPSPGVAGPLQIVYVEGPGEIRYVDDRKAVSAYWRAFARLMAVALSPEETRNFLSYIAGTFR